MREDVRDALDSARSIGVSGGTGVEIRRRASFAGVRAVVLGVIRELPEDMTINELREELENASPR